MAARDEESKAGRGEKEGAVPKLPAARGKSGNDAVLRALSEVEETLNRLKQVRAERAQAEARFKAEIERRDELERSMAAERDEALAGLNEAKDRISALEDEIAQVRNLEKSKLELLADERNEAIAARTELERRVADLEAAVGQDGEARAALAQSLAELDRLRASEQELRATLDQIQERANGADAQAAEVGAELGRVREQADAAGREADALRTRVGELEAELQGVRDGAGDEAGRERARAEDIERRRAELETELAKAHEELARAQQGLTTRALLADESARNAEILAAKVADQDARAAELDALLTQANAQIESLKADCDAAIKAATDAESAARSAAERHEADAARASAQMEELRRTGDIDASLRAELESLKADLATAHAERDALRDQARDAADRLSGRSAEVEELRSKLDLAAERLIELQEALDDRDRRLAAAPSDAGELEALRAELDAARQEFAKLRKRPKSKGAAAPDEAAASRLAMRRERLRRARGLLRDRTRQFDQASGILAERVKMCDDLLARRRELAEAREIIERTHRRVVGGRARTSAAAVIFFAAGLLTVLGGASWAITSHFYPATYVASAVLAADFRGTTPAPEEPDAWESFHQQILFDPQLLGRVAERMQQRGLTDLSAPALVKARFERDLTWNAPEPGKLAFELRGVGREVTARALDTYVTTLEVESNSLRQRRNDSAQTIVAERARAGVEPVADERPYYAAIGLACAALFALLLWFGIWRRMVKAKSAFENGGQIDHLLEEARWVDPIQQIVEAQTNAARSSGRAA